MTGPRIPPGGRRDVGVLTWAFAHVSGVVAGTTAPNLFLTMGRQRKLFYGWLWFAGRLMPGGSLPRRESELVILRVAHLRGSRYEFDHHIRLGRRAGVTAADVDRVRVGPAASGWSDREQAIVAAVDMLDAQRDLDDATWMALGHHLDDAKCIELCLLVGHYEMLATAITALRIQPDQPRHRLHRRAHQRQ